MKSNIKRCFVISKLSFDDSINVGCFTNKSKLYDKLCTMHTTSSIMHFSGVIEYETKKVNYHNITKLLNTINDNEYFYINYVVNNKILVYEIKKIIINI